MQNCSSPETSCGLVPKSSRGIFAAVVWTCSVCVVTAHIDAIMMCVELVIVRTYLHKDKLRIKLIKC